jgi:Pentapeptide repeats (8 copies)
MAVLIGGCVAAVLVVIYFLFALATGRLGLDVSAWWIALAVGAVLGTVVLILGLWRIPIRQAGRLGEDATKKERFDVENEARRTLVQLVSGLAIVATIGLTLYQTNETRKAANRNLRLAAQSQSSQRFDRAINELSAMQGGKKALAPRIGAIYTLAQMGADGDFDAKTVANILAGYVRSGVHAKGEGGFPKATFGPFSSCAGNNIFYSPPPDVEAAMQGLSSINRHFPVKIDLSATNLSGLVLHNLDLASANLRDAILVDADLQQADLRNAVLIETNFQGACLIGADLSETHATEATFDKAHLRNVSIRRACLKGAYLYDFAPQQVAQACVLPEDAGTSQLRTAVRRVCKSISCVY